MSAFGTGTFKQDVLDELNYQISNHEISFIEACNELSEVLGYLISYAFYNDESYIKIKEECYAKAKDDLLNGLKNMEK